MKMKRRFEMKNKITQIVISSENGVTFERNDGSTRTYADGAGRKVFNVVDKMPRHERPYQTCYAGDDWQAICLDFYH